MSSTGTYYAYLFRLKDLSLVGNISGQRGEILQELEHLCSSNRIDPTNHSLRTIDGKNILTDMKPVGQLLSNGAFKLVNSCTILFIQSSKEGTFCFLRVLFSIIFSCIFIRRPNCYHRRPFIRAKGLDHKDPPDGPPISQV